MCIGHMQILWLLYLRYLSIHTTWYLWGSWNQYPMDTEGQWCGFDRYKDEEGSGKIQKEKKNPCIDTIEIWFLIIATSPQCWGARCLLRSAGFGSRPFKKELPVYSICFYLIPFPLSTESLCVLRLAVLEVPALDLAEVSKLTVEKIRKKKVSQKCLKIRRVFFVVLVFCYWWRM